MKQITVSEFLDHINDLIYDNPELLSQPLDGLLVYLNGYESDPVAISTDELEAAE